MELKTLDIKKKEISKFNIWSKSKLGINRGLKLSKAKKLVYSLRSEISLLQDSKSITLMA